MPNPRITIETYLAKVPANQINLLKQQVSAANKEIDKIGASSAGRQGLITDLTKLNTIWAQGNRAISVHTARLAIAQHRINTASEAYLVFKLILKDTFTVVGFMNTALSIMTSRFGSMVLIFGAVAYLRQLSQAMQDATEKFDTADRKLRGIVIPTFGTLEDAMVSLDAKMIIFANRFGVSIEQISDTMFYLASAGRTHAQILNEVEAAQKLSIATAKDMNQSMNDNKQIIETFVGLLNLYGDAIKKGASESEKANHLASIMFGVFKTEQILVSELAVGLSFAANQAKQMNVGIEELVVSIAVLNTSLLKGSKAGTSYTNALRDTIKNQQKLRDLFGIDIGEIGDGFSFLEEVIQKINVALLTSRSRTEVITKLFDVYNVRGVRAVLALADSYDRAHKKVRELINDNSDLEAAFEANSESIKLQKQRFQNLNETMLLFTSIVITGGTGQARNLKILNDILEEGSRVSAVLTIGLTGLTAAFRFLFNMFAGFNLEKFRDVFDEFRTSGGLAKQLGTLGGEGGVANRLVNIGRAFIQYEQAADRTEQRNQLLRHSYIDLKLAIKNADLLMKYASGTITEAEFKVEALKRGILGEADALEEAAKQLKTLESLWRAYGDLLDSEIVPVQDAVMDQLKAVAVNASTAAINLKDPITSLIDASNKLASELDKNYTFIERTTKEKLEKVNVDAFLAIRKAQEETEDAISKLPLADIIGRGVQEQALEAELAIKVLKIIQDREKKKRSIIDSSLKHEVDELRKRNREAIAQERLYGQLSGVRFGEISATDFLKSGRPLTDLVGVTPEFEKANTDLQRFEEIRKEIINSANNEIINLQKDFTRANITHYEAYLRDVSGSESENQRRLIEIWGGGNEKIAEITKSGRNKIKGIVVGYESEIQKAVADQFAGRRKQLEVELENAQKRIQLSADKIEEINRIAADANRELTKDELEQRESLLRSIQETNESSISQFAERSKEIDAEIKRTTDKTIQDIISALQRLVDEANDKGRQVNAALADAYRYIIQQVQNYVQAVYYMSEILDEIADNASDSTTQRTLKIVSLLTKAGATLTDIWVKYWKMMEDNANKAAALTLSIFGTIATITTTLFSIFKKPEERKVELQQEFLNQDSVRAVNPDYGQARVVNNRITLAPTFQFLDARQLTQERQRSLVDWILEGLKEVGKTGEVI